MHQFEPNIEKRYERKAKVRPCSLGPEDLTALAALIQDTFSKPEIDRYFRVSTTLGSNRIFSNSLEDLLNLKELPDQNNDLSFWIEGWNRKSRFDKNVLLDFSRYSAQLHVEGTDPVWVYDKFSNIMKLLKKKTAWYWLIITLEKSIIFCLTMILITSLIIAYVLGARVNYSSTITMLAVWIFLIFYDTRKIWPYCFVRLRSTPSVWTKENLIMGAGIALVVMVLLNGIISPFYR
jgi:hypothetical protein